MGMSSSLKAASCGDHVLRVPAFLFSCSTRLSEASAGLGQSDDLDISWQNFLNAFEFNSISEGLAFVGCTKNRGASGSRDEDDASDVHRKLKPSIWSSMSALESKSPVFN